MVLSNVAIKKAIKDGLIVIQPEPRLDESVLDTTALNLRLGNVISVPKEGLCISFALRQGTIVRTLAQLYEQRKIPEEGYTLKPQNFILANTMEYVALNIKEGKPCYAARVEGKSSLARCGLMVHFTAPTIHAGFSGTITLELMNLGHYPIILYREMPICQLIFEKVEGEISFKQSQFHFQRTPEGHPKL